MRTATPALFLVVSLFVSLVPVAAGAETAMTVGPSKAAGKNMLWNGTFDSETLRPWNVGLDSPDTGRASVMNHQLCVQIDRPGIERRQRRRPAAAARALARASLSAAVCGARHQDDASAGPASARSTRPTPSCGRGRPRRRPTHALRGDLRRRPRRGERRAGDRARRRADRAVPLTVCLDDVELNDPQAELPVERLNPRALPKVRVNQVGYLPGLPRSRPS